MGNFSNMNFPRGGVNWGQIKKFLVDAENEAYTDMKSSMMSLRNAIQEWKGLFPCDNQNNFKSCLGTYHQLSKYTNLKFDETSFGNFEKEIRDFDSVNSGLNVYIRENVPNAANVNHARTGAYNMAYFCFFLFHGKYDQAMIFAKKIINIYAFACCFCAHHNDWWDAYKEYMRNNNADVDYSKFEHLEIIYDFFRELLGVNRAFSNKLIPIDQWELTDGCQRITDHYNGYSVHQGVYYRENEDLGSKEFAVIRVYSGDWENANIQHLNEINARDPVYRNMNFGSIKIKQFKLNGSPGGFERTLSSYVWLVQHFRSQPIILSDLITRLNSRNSRNNSDQRLNVAYKTGVMIRELNEQNIFLRTITDKFIALEQDEDGKYTAYPTNLNDARMQRARTKTVLYNAQIFFTPQNEFCAPELYNITDPTAISDRGWALADAYAYGMLVLKILSQEQRERPRLNSFIQALISDDLNTRCTMNDSGLLRELLNN